MSARIVVVTGTNTGVGKTIATAALAVRELAAGHRTLVIKPAQTGTISPDGGPGDSDAAEIHRLTGVEVQEWTTLDEPLAPDTAARRAGVAIPTVSEYVDRIRVAAESYDVAIVEGAGGLLVRLDTEGGTIRDIAVALSQTHTVEVVVVTAAGLGTLNHTELTVEALRSHGIEPTGLILGSFPTNPGLAEGLNGDELVRVTGLPMLAVIPDGAGILDRMAFLAAAPSWFA